MLRSLLLAMRRRQVYRRAARGSAGAVILRYHSVGEPGVVGAYLDPGLSVTPSRFREHVETLARVSDIVTVEDLPALLAEERRGRLRSLITFDDGYRDNYEFALPILLEVGVPATFYVTTTPLRSRRGLWTSELWRLIPRLPVGAPIVLDHAPDEVVPEDPSKKHLLLRRITRRLAGLNAGEREHALDTLAKLADVPRGDGLENSFLTEDRVRSLRDAGMLVGAHTRTHPHLDQLDPAHHAEEVRGSRDDLEKILGEKVHHFAYTNPGGSGRFGVQARKSVEAAGFITSVTSTPHPLNPDVDLLSLPRLGVYGEQQSRILFTQLAKVARV